MAGPETIPLEDTHQWRSLMKATYSLYQHSIKINDNQFF